MNSIFSILLLRQTLAIDYVLVDYESKTWDAAELYCNQRYGTNLATVVDDTSATDLLSLAKTTTSDPWIGITDQAPYSVLGSWVFTDGTACPITDRHCVTYWNTGEPNDVSERCGSVIKSTASTDIQLMLNDLACTHSAPFICNKPEPEYVLVEQALTWQAAEDYCESTYGTTLATIFDDDSAQKLLDMRMSFGQRVWVGLNDLAVEGTYEWESGILCPPTGCVAGSYPYFASFGTDDSGGNEDCYEIYALDGANINGMLNDALCTSTYYIKGFICDAPQDWGLECPSGSTLIGAQGGDNDISGCGLEGCEARYGDNYASIEECEAACEARNDCISYTWAATSGDQNVDLQTVCTLYDNDVPNQAWGPQQIMCKPSCVWPLAALDGLLTVEEDGLGWITAFACQDGAQSLPHDFTYLPPFNDYNGFVALAQYAKSIKFETTSGISVTAVECGNPIQALNLGLDMSYTIDSTGTVTGFGVSSDWTGDNEYLWNTCYGGGLTDVGQPAVSLSTSFYWACNNGLGLHMEQNTCSINSDLVSPITVSLGFHSGLATDCYGNDLTCGSNGACGAASTFIWEELMGDNIGEPNLEYELNITESALTLDIDIKVDYLGATAADDNGYVYGTTYVIDFEDYDVHKDNIREPGTCQNRNNIATSVLWNDVWSYSTTPNVAGHIDQSDAYLAYGASPFWSITMDAEDDPDPCGTVQYSASFSWSDLTLCSDYTQTKRYISTVDETDKITLSGTLYVNVVSPLDYSADYSFYRVYQLLSQPFQIVLSKTVYVVDSVGTMLCGIHIISVYKEDGENTFKLILLTEVSEYMYLDRSALGIYLESFSPDVTNTGGITAGDFTALTATENVGCLSNKAYVCSQLWQIKAVNATCDGNDKYTDFSGTYTMQFDPKCRDDMGADTETYCMTWMGDHMDEITHGTGKVLLSTSLKWKDEICTPEVFDVAFTATMQFFPDETYAAEVTDTYLYQVGEDTIYVEVATNYPSDHMDVFKTKLIGVWICTFDPLIAPDPFSSGTESGGCFSTTIDNNDFHNHIYEAGTDDTFEGFVLNTAPTNDVVRFQFDVPNEAARDKLYVHAQIEVSLTESGRRRRLPVMGAMKEANQMDHFVNKIGITVEAPNNDDKPPNNDMEPPPQHPFIISLYSQWGITIGCLLALVLTFNVVFICYVNCTNSYNNGRRYSVVKSTDSEYSEHDAINVVSD